MGGETNGKTTDLNPTFTVSPFNSSSSSNGLPNFLVTLSQRHFNSDKYETESQSSSGSSVDSVFGSVPTRLEVEYAISAFQSFMMQGLSSSMSILDQLQPLLNHHDPNILEPTGFQRVYDAFRLLQTVSSVRRMVVSISSDKTVWDAVMRNNEVQEFRRSLQQAEASRGSSTAEPDSVSMIMRWILGNMKLNVLQLIETLKSLLVNKSFESSQNRNTNSELKEGFEELIVSTVLLSTITLMIVLVTRAYGA